jgi:HPt (histidine-containing phosphotransfer) domain-containing protein
VAFRTARSTVSDLVLRMTEQKVLDHARLRALCRGDAELMRDVLETLVVEAATLLGDLQIAVATQNGATATESVGALEGIARNVGAHELESLARDVEEAIAAYNWAAVESDMGSIAAAIERLRRSSAELA